MLEQAVRIGLVRVERADKAHGYVRVDQNHIVAEPP